MHYRAWRNSEQALLEHLYGILRDYQDGKLQGNGTAVGQLDQPLTEVADRIQVELRKHVKSWNRESNVKSNER